MDWEDVPKVSACMQNLNEPSGSQEMYLWSFIYFHGELQSYYDSINLSPGDLVACSMGPEEYPLGMTRIEVAGSMAIAYLWEDKSIRRGLIVWEKDSEERHAYAKECMVEKRIRI